MPKRHDFALQTERRIEEYDILARFYRHRRTGAELLSIISPDDNKVFGAVFKTPAADSTGLPHILEHSVLCGSRKYPVKEPFVELLKSSLQTFLNAFTYPDKTCYPVASANLADFHNLVDVYLDACFHPRIPEEIFGQEGWHFHPGQDESLGFKGVVYNEMKGAYSSPESLLAEQSQRQTFPDVTYGFDSGGEPAHIPSLTYEQFKQFHARYYHPSNCRFFFHGDDDPERRLEILEEYLKDFEPIHVQSEVGLQPRFHEPRHVRAPYACAPTQDGRELKAYFTINWLLPEVRDMEEVLALSVLEHCLIGLPGSPLRRALIASGLGEDLAGGGLETELRQMYFSVGLKGVNTANLEASQALLLDALRRIRDEGLSPEDAEAAINTIEFRLRENNTGSYPRGLSLMLRALTTWLHGGDPLAPLAFQAPLDALKARLASGEKLLERLLTEHFLDNPHRVHVVLEPDPGMTERLTREEQERVTAAQAALSERERDKALDLARRIERFQETPDTPEDLATIPKLRLDDLPRRNKVIPGQWMGEVFFHDLPTNGVVYLELAFDLAGIEHRLVPLVPLFGRALLEMGTDEEDFAVFLNRAARKTGGVGRDISTSSVLGQGPERASSRLIVAGKATPDKASDFLDILHKALTRANLEDKERFRQMLLEAKARAERRLTPSGHAYAARRLKARFTRAAAADERMGGLTGIEHLRAWAADFDAAWPGLLEDLRHLRETVIRQGNLQANVTLDARNFKDFHPRLADMTASLPQGRSGDEAWPGPQLPEREGLVAPVQVNYVAQGRNLDSLGYVPHGSMQVACRYLRSAYLWERVRVRGGAYGAFSSFDRWANTLSMVSYRDPNIVKTLEAFAGAGRFLSTLDIAPDELERAIIGTVGDIDSVMLPDAQGHAAIARHWAADSDDNRQRLREQVLATSLEDLRACGEVISRAMEGAPVVVLGSGESLEAAGKELGGMVLTKAL